MNIQSNFVKRAITGSVFVIAILASMLNIWIFSILMSVLWILMIVEYRKMLKENGSPEQKKNLWYSFFAYFYIILPLVCLIYIYTISPLYALALFAFVWVNDTFAYLVGIKFGKTKLFERISPKKTWEGFFGGLIFAGFAGFLFAYFTSDVAFPCDRFKWIGLAIVVVIFGTIGDLFESYLNAV